MNKRLDAKTLEATAGVNDLLPQTSNASSSRRPASHGAATPAPNTVAQLHFHASPSVGADDFGLTTPDFGSASSMIDPINQPWDDVLAGVYENTSFFDLDSLVSGGKFWNSLS